jgi:hypothetical protein
MVNYTISQNGYFYKEYKNGKKIRISRNEYNKKNKQVGGGNKQWLIDNFYLGTEVNIDHEVDELMPFGYYKNIKQHLQSISGVKGAINPYAKNDLNQITSLYKNIPRKRGMGITKLQPTGTEYGIYFRFVLKNLVNNKTYEKFTNKRSFLFNIEDFLNYILEKTDELKINNIPLFYFNPLDQSGAESKANSILLRPKSKYNPDPIGDFLERVSDKITKTNIYYHECVSRIPIPLNSNSGYFKKINLGIIQLQNKSFFNNNQNKSLSNNNQNKSLSNNNQNNSFFNNNQNKFSSEKIRCSKFNGKSTECKKENCWYHYDTKKCNVHYKKIMI